MINVLLSLLCIAYPLLPIYRNQMMQIAMTFAFVTIKQVLAQLMSIAATGMTLSMATCPERTYNLVTEQVTRSMNKAINSTPGRLLTGKIYVCAQIAYEAAEQSMWWIFMDKEAGIPIVLSLLLL
jgi:hypothetical protein